ncbi:MAG: hypothetical protein J1E33_03695 [Alistipes sp.]|nr:hypothetical protein [Alistipes sp.]
MGKQNLLKARHQQRNDTAARWTEVNPVMLKGEVGIELDTKRQKVGDGVTPWNDLDYLDKALYEAIETEKDRLDAANADIAKITNLLKNGATLDEAKSALAEFGEGYRDLYEVAKTLHTFLNLEDPNDVIDRWQEVESFLQGITDAQTLTGLLESLRSEITTAYQNAVKTEKERAEGAEKALFDRVDALEEFNEDGALEDKINEVVDERFADDVYILDGGNAAGHTI